ncbi:thioredoxin domain-containing protein [Candidatus Gottesmanbacteria bacterium]|nr:thioredoxin domain-containing protein [Candidatus Gottesmanbacteria bacterium]
MEKITKYPQTGGIVQAAIVILLVVCAFLLGSLWTKVQILERGGTGQPSAAPPQAAQPPTQEAKDVPKVTNDDHVRGDRSARIALIEYSDLECPFCKSVHPTITQVLDAYNGRVSWVYRHYPLSFHANAQKEAEAAECAGELGGDDAFWKYVDAIFERTTSNGTGFALDKLVPLAGELGLPEAKFKECLDSGKYEKHVTEDIAGGSKAGVTGTPGNILLDTKSGKTRLIPGAVPLASFKTAIDEMLK